MCGIAGFAGESIPSPIKPRLAAMLNAMPHRGPDGDGVWAAPEGRCGLAHNRLAIIDPEGGRQPLANEDETLWISFNGCIYNYPELRGALEAAGHRFRTRSDTEVIVHAYEQWGPDCVTRFNGMWAFAIWDEKSRTLFCSRDRIGIKPFYYTWDGSTLAFASEIKALLAAGAVDPKASAEGVRHYLTFQLCLNDTTLFDGVRKLPPGHNLILKPGRAPEQTCYWDARFDIDEEHDEPYFVEQLSDLLEDAVRLRLRADVPLGAHLSGGLDSSTTVSLARRLLGDGPLKTFTGAFREGRGFDETEYAKTVSREMRADYLETYLGPDDFAASMERIIWLMDEPAAGPGVFAQYGVSKLAAQHVKVVLGGQGGDELFIGYARYLVAYLEECIKGAIENTAHRSRYVATLESIIPSLPSLEGYVPMLKSFWQDGLFAEPSRRYFRLMNRFPDGRSLLHADFAVDTERSYEEFREIFDNHGAASMINRILYFDLKTHLPALLHVEDRTSMGWGLESRVPLLDHRLVELMASVPPVIKFKDGQLKTLFRQAVAGLVPAAILERKDKMGFPVPLAQWFKGPLRDFVADILTSQACRERGLFDTGALEAAIDSEQPFSRSLWGALNLELWHRQFIDSPSAAPTTERHEPSPAIRKR